MIGEHESNIEMDKYQEISAFWSNQLNNEIYLRGKINVVRGSKEYFDIILNSRQKYIYYFQKMIDFLKMAPNRSLVDIGCGMGTDSLVLVQHGFQVTGIDLAPGHLKLARQLFALYQVSGTFVEGNAERMPFPEREFGCASSFGVLHHTPNTAKAIQEVHRILQPSGRAVIMLYNFWSFNNFVHWVLRRGFENARCEEGVNKIDAPVTKRFSRQQVKEMCSSFSKCEIDIEYLYGAGYGRAYDMIPQIVYRMLSRFLGWHLVIFLEK